MKNERQSMGKILIVVAYVFFCYLGIVLIKLGSDQSMIKLAKHILLLNLSVQTILGLIAYIISFLLYISLISKFNLSFIMPIITGIGYICTVAISVIVLKEHINKYQLIGIAVITLGIIFMNIKPEVV
jgi:drug/metabolite transporter (DMT)-like permease